MITSFVAIELVLELSDAPSYVHNKTMLIKINQAILYRIIKDYTC